MSTLTRIRFSSLVLSSAALALCGCSVFNPHLQLPKAKRDGYISCVEIVCATNYANEWRERYHSAAGHDSILRNSVALGIIPLSALAVYRGVTSSNHAHNIAALGVGAAGLYTSGNYLQSSSRQKVYIAGSQAIGCALVATKPLRVDVGPLSSNLSALTQALTNEDVALVNAQAWLDQASEPGAVDPDDLAAAKAQVSATQATRTDAQQVWQNAAAYKTTVDQAGYTLKVAVDAIRDQVDSKVSDTEPDLQSLVNAAGGIGKLALSFEATTNSTAPATATPKVTTPPSNADVKLKGKAPIKPEVVDGLKRSLEVLHGATQTLVNAANAVRGYLNTAAISKVDDAIGACKVADVDAGFQVTPSADKQTLSAGQKLRFTVTSDSGIPRAARSGADVSGVDLSTELEQGSFVAVVSASSSTPGGTFVLVLTDGTGKHQKSITITVSKGTPAAQTPPPKPPVTPPPNGSQPYTAAQIKSIQTALNDKKLADPALVVDGKMGSSTGTAIKAYQKSLQHSETGTLTQDEFISLTTGTNAPPKDTPAPPAPPTPAPPNASCPAAAANDFEKALTKPQITNLQEALGIPAAKRSGSFDTATRAGIKAFSASNSEPADQKCLLSADKMKAILGGKK